MWQKTSEGKVPGISGNVDMNIMLLKKFFVNPIITADGTDIAKTGPRRLLHHVSHHACQRYLTLPRHNVHLYLQGISAYACPGQSPDNPNLVRFICHVKYKLRLSQVTAQIIFRQPDGLFILL